MSLPPDLLATLSAILQTGSFEGAARALGLTQSAISQRLKALETRVGAQLIHRTTPCTATPVGQRLAANADQIALLEARLGDDLTGMTPAPQTRLRLAVNADSLATWLPAALASLPGHLFDLVIDDQDVSHDRLMRGEVLGALTTRASPHYPAAMCWRSGRCATRPSPARISSPATLPTGSPPRVSPVPRCCNSI